MNIDVVIGCDVIYNCWRIMTFCRIVRILDYIDIKIMMRSQILYHDNEKVHRHLKMGMGIRKYVEVYIKNCQLTHLLLQPKQVNNAQFLITHCNENKTETLLCISLQNIMLQIWLILKLQVISKFNTFEHNWNIKTKVKTIKFDT